MGMKWKNPPICYALVQVKFNSILTFDQYMPAIQDSFRRAGFPDFQKIFTAAINLNLTPQPVVENSVAALSIPQTRYRFMSATRHAGFVLDPTFVMFETTHYDTFESFLAEFMRGLGFIHKNVELSYFERLGVRFLDAIIPNDGEDVTLYLKPEMTGLAGKLPKRQLIHSVSETRTDRDKAVLMSRAVIYRLVQKGPIALPPDLQMQLGLKLADKFSNVNEGIHALIDTDSWCEERSDAFDLREIERRLTGLHTELRHSFDLMISDYAIKMWK